MCHSLINALIRKFFLVLVLFVSSWRTQAQGDSVQHIDLDPVIQYKLGSGSIDYPLKPPTTTSPRATLFSFIEYLNRSHQLLMEAHEENRNPTGSTSSDSVRIKAKQAEILFQRAVECLDLSAIPPFLQKDLSYERTLLLKEIIDRVVIPPYAQIPDEVMIELEQEEEKVPELDRWSIPNTDLVIARVMEGPRKNEFLFTPRTIARLETFYQRVRRLPYKTDVYTSDHFYEFYISTPGRLLPPKWTHRLPTWLTQTTYFSQTRWQWFGLVGCVVLAFVAIRSLYWFLMRSRGMRSFIDAAWRKSLFFFGTGSIILMAERFDEVFLNLTGTVEVILWNFFSVLFWGALSASSYFLVAAVGETLVNSKKAGLKPIQMAYSRILYFILSLMTAMVIVVIGLSQLGISLIPLIAGAGIGGLAIALGAQTTMENIFSSLTIFSQKPYRMGSEIEVLGYTGNVVEIGLAATKIQLLTGRIVTIPNKNMAGAQIENIGDRPFARKEFEIVISYSGQPEKVAKAIELLREILSVPESPKETDPVPHPNELINWEGKKPKVNLREFRDDDQVIWVCYWYQSADYWAFQEHTTWINEQILNRFHGEGIEFAIPTQKVQVQDGTVS